MKLIKFSEFYTVQEAFSVSGREAYFNFIPKVCNIVSFSQSVEITALPVRRKILFNRFAIYDYAEAILTVLHIGISSQLVGRDSILPKYICKKKFYFINSIGNIEAITLDVIAKGLE